MRLLLALAALAAALPAAASGIEIQADKAQYDDEAGVFRFTGDVTALGDGIALTADRLDVRTGDGDHRYSATGKPARIEIETEGGRRLRARGSPIVLFASSGRLEVAGGAVEAGGESLTARRIVRSADGSIDADGSVVLVRETISLGGEALDANGLGAGGQAVITGAPATVSTGEGGADGDDPGMSASALTMRLKPDENRLELTGEAVAKSGGGEIAGDVIVYNTLERTFVATGGTERNRVKMVMESAGEQDGAEDADEPEEDAPENPGGG